MLDFLLIATRYSRNGVVELYPKFVVKKSKDLIIRGGSFYAIWIEDKGLWSDDIQDAIDLIDSILKQKAIEYREKNGVEPKVLYLWDAESGMIDRWLKFCEKQMTENYQMHKTLNENIIFSNTKISKKDYATRRLGYPLEKGDISAYEKIISTLYSEEERHKIEWAIGSIVTGASKTLQKFIVLYGGPGTGKSTILNIIQKLFEGYYSVFDAKSLGSNNAQFALEAFRKNPLVAIQHDGDLSRIEDNTRLNSLTSHETMLVNEKHKGQYEASFRAFLFMGTNKPVKITDAKSGIIRRLIDVTPTGNKLSVREYNRAVKQVSFELGAIAYHCKEVFLENPDFYDDYIPTSMMGASNDFYNYILDNYRMFSEEEGVSLKTSWELYKNYCEDAKVPYPLSQRLFKEELKNYFSEFHMRYSTSDGVRVRNFYTGFLTDKFERNEEVKPKKEEKLNTINFVDNVRSVLDIQCAECPAQYASSKGTPLEKWDTVDTKLSEINTSRVHYVKVPENHIVIDFDIPGEDGSKSFEKNLEEASKWPATYAELSKSGAGIHLHYIYKGDVTKLSRVYDDKIEVKVFTGKSSLRRKLTKCNDLPIATISSGLPLKGEKKMVNNEVIKSEKGLRVMIKRNLNKEFHPGTKPSIDFIDKILSDAYDSGLCYDVTDMRNAVLAFGANSTNQADYCIKLVGKMKFKSVEQSKPVVDEDAKLIFYDVEVFPNLLLVNWKIEGEGKPVVRMINPKPEEIERLMKFRLVGFNCRRYDNHILYARLMGYSNEQIYNLSQRIINGERKAFFGEAYNVSYTDVYDFCSKKQSLKKWEIELGIHHQELGLPWDQPVPEHMWEKVAQYCDNDVIATEAVFNARKADFVARQILADIADMTVNDTSNTLTTKIIFGNNRKPQSQFNYRFMGELPNNETLYTFDNPCDIGRRDWTPGENYTVFDTLGKPYFPDYKYERGVSTYRGEEVGEGGYVYAEQGMYTNVALLDIAAMHPSSAIAEKLFGEYTYRYEELLKIRLYIKHDQYDEARKMLDGKLAKYLDNKDMAKALSNALKIPINSVYGLTSANFDNAFRDNRNKENIVAKRGALFMINLKHEVQKRGFTVAHIKTDSIKIPDANLDIIQFVMEYGKAYGYTFEHEATYEKMCLVNDAVYISKNATVEQCIKLYGEEYVYADPSNVKKNKDNPGEWDATGAQFQVPVVFKRLFTRESVTFDDLCETKAVSSSLYLDMNEDLPDVTAEEKELAKIEKNLRDGESNMSPEQWDEATGELKDIIAKGHNYKFIGKVGSFCPIKPGCGGGVLYREKDGKYYAATGTKGYRWLESEMVQTLGKENDIDMEYYDNLVNDAVEDISQYGDFEWFVSDDPVGEYNLISRQPTF